VAGTFEVREITQQPHFLWRSGRIQGYKVLTQKAKTTGAPRTCRDNFGPGTGIQR
jgi:hypothetical protein